MRITLALVLGASIFLAITNVSTATAPGLPCQDVRGCPDLTVDAHDLKSAFIRTETFASTDCAVVEGMTQSGQRRLLRFTTTYPNEGSGSLIIGDPREHRKLFEFSTCHGHYHFREYADYRLWTAAGYQLWTSVKVANPGALSGDLLKSHPEVASQMIESAKRGFCVIDLLQLLNKKEADLQTYTSCATNQGISAGWADQYFWALDGQWIDVTGVAPGDYFLEVEVNAERVFEEASYANNSAAVPVKIR